MDEPFALLIICFANYVFASLQRVAFHSFVADKFLKSRVWAVEIPNISTKIYVELNK